MGIFRPTNIIKWPVKVILPKGDGSKKTDTEQFNITVKILDEEERKEIPAIGKDSTTEEIIEFNRKTTEMALNNIEGWDLQGLEFDSVNEEKVYNDPFYRKGIIEAFWQAQNGGVSKN